MRLIDADVTKRTYTADLFDTEEDFERVNDIFDYAPTVDTEVVVRCKDCRYRGIIFCPAIHETMGNGFVDYTSDEAYCWRGRPKEDADAT